MARLFCRALAVQVEMGLESSPKWIRFRVGGRSRLGRFRRLDRRNGIDGAVAERFHDTLEPLFGVFLVIDIAIDTGMNALRSEFLQSAIEILSGLAKLGVIRVTQRENRVFHVSELWSGIAFELVPESLGVVGHFSVAIGAGHNGDAGFRGEVDLRMIFHAECARAKT